MRLTPHLTKVQHLKYVFCLFKHCLQPNQITSKWTHCIYYPLVIFLPNTMYVKTLCKYLYTRDWSLVNFVQLGSYAISSFLGVTQALPLKCVHRILLALALWKPIMVLNCNNMKFYSMLISLKFSTCYYLYGRICWAQDRMSQKHLEWFLSLQWLLSHMSLPHSNLSTKWITSYSRLSLLNTLGSIH